MSYRILCFGWPVGAFTSFRLLPRKGWHSKVIPSRPNYWSYPSTLLISLVYSLPSREGRIHEANKSSDSLVLRLTHQVYTDRPFEIWAILMKLKGIGIIVLWLEYEMFLTDSCVWHLCGSVGGQLQEAACLEEVGHQCSFHVPAFGVSPGPALSFSGLPDCHGESHPPCQDRLKPLSSWAQMNFLSFEVVSIRRFILVTQDDYPRKNDKIIFKLSMRMCLEIRTIFGKYGVKSV